MHGQRLTHSQVKPIRDQILAGQGGKCAICKRPLKASEIPALDHDHHTGAIRGTLHHSCNTILGKIENNAGRFGLAGHIIEFCMGVGPYLQRHKTNVTGMIHPTHLSDEEKRIKKNTKARTVRAKAKKASA